ncbi:MAG: VanZ family protein [Bacteroidales bacterium]|nr:VanZ family protein [Bacteroidales bacterium]
MIAKLFTKKWPFAAYVALIILLVTLPLNTSDNLNNITILQLRGDYFLHILLFMPWAFFFKTFHIKLSYWMLLALFFASATEGLQYLLPYRSYNINDLLANLLGILVGFALALLINIRKRG